MENAYEVMRKSNNLNIILVAINQTYDDLPYCLPYLTILKCLIMFHYIRRLLIKIRRVASKDTSILNQFLYINRKTFFHLIPKIPFTMDGMLLVLSNNVFNEKDEKETLIEKDELNEETFDGFFEL